MARKNDNPKPGTKEFYENANNNIHEAMQSFKKCVQDAKDRGYQPVGIVLDMLMEKNGETAHLDEVSIPNHHKYLVSTVSTLTDVTHQIAQGDISVMLEGMLHQQSRETAPPGKLQGFLDSFLKPPPPSTPPGR
jgi:hypothetical protein